MGKIELKIPKFGESVEKVTLTKWLFSEGDWINIEDIVAEISTDKVDGDIHCSYNGKLIKQCFSEGEDIKVGEVFAIIDEAEKNQTSTNNYAKEAELSIQKNIKPIDNNIFLSPLVKKIIKEENITSTEIDKIIGTGLKGRISKNDVLKYLNRRNYQNSSTKPEDTVVSASFSSSISEETEIIEMDKMRRIIIQHMKKSKQTSPHVTAFIEADVTNLTNWRDTHKEEFLKKHKQKLTITPLIVDACVKAIKDFPMINVSVDETETKIIKHLSINIGIATALDNGNLIVPVIKNAGELNLEGLTKKINHLINKARNNQLEPDDVFGGTFTISNIGTFGNIMGTPIINQPEVAILATGVINKKPAVLETTEGDVIAIRKFMFLSLSFDHRVVDGSLGGVFLSQIAKYLENWDMSRQI